MSGNNNNYYYVENKRLYKAVFNIDTTQTLDVTELISETVIDTIPGGETFISLDGKIIKTDKAFYKIDTFIYTEIGYKVKN